MDRKFEKSGVNDFKNFKERSYSRNLYNKNSNHQYIRHSLSLFNFFASPSLYINSDGNIMDTKLFDFIKKQANFFLVITLILYIKNVRNEKHCQKKLSTGKFLMAFIFLISKKKYREYINILEKRYLYP
ncbi:hypothetical protein EDEG_00898 [Edhazardia aedis USNM 41457]|uniref:Uncharacterized protein n=1 Tax=Edhazardia aedis (strain USNM 41457) TaxID=1003232 RepID=J9DR00_EDHAE|nr:hypothetical protein EDEG_00898 [Edhazardia aedis USNM 41457]|eukprot:EJW05005.1 hypothetical protein EDEG_00898 [Edhazardia aedis USNM 41457]